jgi:hypothetical protein
MEPGGNLFVHAVVLVHPPWASAETIEPKAPALCPVGAISFGGSQRA